MLMKNTHGQVSPLGDDAAEEHAGGAAGGGGRAVDGEAPWSAPWGSEPKSIISRVSADGAISAAPAPWTARPAISTPVESARPAASEPAARTAQPAAEDAPGAEQVGQPAAEQQQAAEGDDVGVEDPGQVCSG